LKVRQRLKEVITINNLSHKIFFSQNSDKIKLKKLPKDSLPSLIKEINFSPKKLSWFLKNSKKACQTFFLLSFCSISRMR